MAKHRKPKKYTWNILWGWWPSRRSKAVERYRATHKPLWLDGELTVETSVSTEEEKDA